MRGHLVHRRARGEQLRDDFREAACAEGRRGGAERAPRAATAKARMDSRRAWTRVSLRPFRELFWRRRLKVILKSGAETRQVEQAAPGAGQRQGGPRSARAALSGEAAGGVRGATFRGSHERSQPKHRRSVRLAPADVSNQYGGMDETCPLCTGGRGGGAALPLYRRAPPPPSPILSPTARPTVASPPRPCPYTSPYARTKRGPGTGRAGCRARGAGRGARRAAGGGRARAAAPLRRSSRTTAQSPAGARRARQLFLRVNFSCAPTFSAEFGAKAAALAPPPTPAGATARVRAAAGGARRGGRRERGRPG